MTVLSHEAPAVTLGEDDRGAFIVRVYQHVAAAVAAFIAIEALFFMTGVAEGLYDFVSGGGVRWLLILGGFMIGNWFVTQAAYDLGNPGRQYASLLGIAALEALIFAPFLFYVYRVADAGSTVAAAAVVTGIGFAILTAIGLFTRKDLSFIRPLIMWGFGIALVLIIGAVLFGFNLGVWFSVAMIGLSGAAILYQTQTILRQYPASAYVPAAISLFGSLMTMFWYVLRLFMALRE
ncbi:MAG: Bax inhibitor-1 family protein [Actinomycetota bacterium]